MRWLPLIGLLVLGCSNNAVPAPEAAILPPERPRPGPQQQVSFRLPDGDSSTPVQDRADVPDLRTRKTGSDWPSFLGPHRDSISAEKGIIAPWPKEGLRIVWQKRVGIGYGMPSVSKGRLYHFDRRRIRGLYFVAQFGNICSLTPQLLPTLPFATLDTISLEDQATLTCMNSETGEFLWEFQYPTEYEDLYGYNNGPRCSPVIDDDRVYIYGAEGMLHCLDARSGAVKWKHDTAAEFGVVQNFFGVGSTPLLEGDVLIAQVGGSPKGERLRLTQKGNGTGVIAFDKHTGKIKWKSSDELASYSCPVTATIDGKRWLFVFARGGLLGMDPATGKERFHFPWRARILESVNAACPVVVGDKVFISETYGPGSALLQIKGDGFKVLWSDANENQNTAMQCHWNTPIHHDGYLYGSSGRHEYNAELRCIELATGKVMWSVPKLQRCSLLMVDGHFICMCEDGQLRLLKVNPKKYEEVSLLALRDKEGRNLLREPCWEAPILAHGLLYVRGADRIMCLELIPKK
ncbi:MAG: PQQ-binding-like beta-propeller repeat protein [Gemmataceae bacterium]